MYILILFFSFFNLTENDNIYDGQRQLMALVNIIKDVEYEYFDVTSNIMSNDLSENFETSKLESLLKDIYVVSENLETFTSTKKINIEKIRPKTEFDEIRQITLKNFSSIRKMLLSIDKSDSTINLLRFVKYVQTIKLLNQEIIKYRENVGTNYTPTPPKKNQMKDSKAFESTLGADGISNDQWIDILKSRSGSKTSDLIRLKSRQNNLMLIELKNNEKSIVKAGEIERIEVKTNLVNGIRYTYSDFPPDQLSLNYSTDKAFVEGLIRWMIYINAGNKVKLESILAIQKKFNYINNSWIREPKDSVLTYNNRTIKDKFSNSIDFFINEYHLNSKYQVDQIHISDSIINFYGKDSSTSDLEKMISLITIKKNTGNLFKQIKHIINQMKDGSINFTTIDMGLNKY
tara:strand:+ start:14788 stop:15996 length:1209 start_codon:yes stop_codon:yes gene_type:complete